MYICTLFEISLSDLIFIEKPVGKFSLSARILGTFFKVGDEKYKLEGKSIKMILVDHHKPIGELLHFEIDTIIDHHVLGETSLLAKRIYFDTDVGSCCTLISKFIGQSLISKNHTKHEIYRDDNFCQEMARMLLIPIYLDTNKFKKVTSHFDKGEFRKLLKVANMKKKAVKKIVKTIKRVRRNDSKIETDIILKKDYKGFEKDGVHFGYATVKYDFKEWVDREAAKSKVGSDNKAGLILESQFSFFRRENGLDFLLVNLKLGPKRYLACINCPFEKQLAESQNFKPLEYKGFHYYELAVEKTRKILTPAIKDLLKNLSLSSKKLE